MTSKATKLPKVVIFSAHAENVAPVLHALGHPLTLNPVPASMVLVNFYKSKSRKDIDPRKYWVEGTYLPNARETD